MTQSVAIQNDGADRVLEVLVSGNLAALTPADRLQYFERVCDSLKLNPLTKPFEFLTLNNKLVLYATKACTDQLRQVHGVSIEVAPQHQGDLYVVTATATDATGRSDADVGVVNIKGLVGEYLANAIMKATTKAKRRVTLSICGLGMLDETEIDSIPASAKGPRQPVVMPQARIAPPNVDTATGEILEDEDDDDGPTSQPAPAAAAPLSNNPTSTQQPAMGLGDTTEPPASDDELQTFWTDVRRMGFDEGKVHSFAGVDTTKGLSKRRLNQIKTGLAAVRRQEAS